MLSYLYQADSPAQRREIALKKARIHQILQEHQLNGLVLNTQHNFAWATGGANNWVSIAGEGGIAALVYRADGRAYVVADNIEGPRLTEEEKLTELGFEFMPSPWWEADRRGHFLLELAGGQKVGSDTSLDGATNLAGSVAQARYSLTTDERDRYRLVCQATAEALETVCREIVPGQTEWEVAGYLAQACYQRGLIPFVTLVAADDRVYKYRHPIPTFRTVEQYAMVVLCAKAGGLIANCTRLVHFGPVSPELIQKHRELLTVDAVFNLNTRPGASVGQIFAQAQAAYGYAGFPDEWQLHHQGGATGYEGRDYRVGPGSTEIVQEWQAFAWNPSITGSKSEDTVLVSSEAGHEIEVLTRPPDSDWPMATVTIEGLGSIERPDILEK